MLLGITIPPTGIERLAGIADVTAQLVTLLRTHLLPSLAALPPLLAELFALLGRQFTHRHALPRPLESGWRWGWAILLRMHHWRNNTHEQQEESAGKLFHERILGWPVLRAWRAL